MREIYLHIGLHKTATTYLQSAVFPLIKEDVTYISGALNTQLVRDITTTDSSIFSVENIRNSVLNYDQRKAPILISSENLSGHPGIKYMNRSMVLERLKKIFPDAKIILGLREQWSLLGSMYKLYIQNGGTKTFENYVYKNNKVYPNESYFGLYNRIDLDLFKYTPLLKQIDALFGFSNVHIFNFENFKTNSTQEINGLLRFMAVASSTEFNNHQVNKSISWASVEPYRHANKLCKSNYHEGGVFSRDGILFKFLCFMFKMYNFKQVSHSQFIKYKNLGLYNQDLLDLRENFKINLT